MDLFNFKKIIPIFVVLASPDGLAVDILDKDKEKEDKPYLNEFAELGLDKIENDLKTKEKELFNAFYCIKNFRVALSEKGDLYKLIVQLFQNEKLRGFLSTFSPKKFLEYATQAKQEVQDLITTLKGDVKSPQGILLKELLVKAKTFSQEWKNDMALIREELGKANSGFSNHYEEMQIRFLRKTSDIKNNFEKLIQMVSQFTQGIAEKVNSSSHRFVEKLLDENLHVESDKIKELLAKVSNSNKNVVNSYINTKKKNINNFFKNKSNIDEKSIKFYEKEREKLNEFLDFYEQDNDHVKKDNDHEKKRIKLYEDYI